MITEETEWGGEGKGTCEGEKGGGHIPLISLSSSHLQNAHNFLLTHHLKIPWVFMPQQPQHTHTQPIYSPYTYRLIVAFFSFLRSTCRPPSLQHSIISLSSIELVQAGKETPPFLVDFTSRADCDPFPFLSFPYPPSLVSPHPSSLPHPLLTPWRTDLKRNIAPGKPGQSRTRAVGKMLKRTTLVPLPLLLAVELRSRPGVIWTGIRVVFMSLKSTEPPWSLPRSLSP